MKADQAKSSYGFCLFVCFPWHPRRLNSSVFLAVRLGAILTFWPMLHRWKYCLGLPQKSSPTSSAHSLPLLQGPQRYGFEWQEGQIGKNRITETALGGEPPGRSIRSVSESNMTKKYTLIVLSC